MGFDQIEEFDWDEDKALRNLEKHGISFEEAAQALEDAFDSGKVQGPSTRHGEPRWIARGSGYGRPLQVIFTIRGQAARIISARRR